MHLPSNNQDLKGSLVPKYKRDMIQDNIVIVDIQNHGNSDKQTLPDENTPNSPIVCVLLALDSWDYCSGERA